MQCRQTAGCSAGIAKAYDDQRACWKLARGIWSVLGVLSVWRLANGRLERSKNRGLCSAGKRQAAALEQQRLMTRGLGGSCRAGFGGFEGQTAGGWSICSQEKPVPHLRWSQAPPLPWRRPGSADFYDRSMRFLWDSHGIPMLFHDISVGLLWDVNSK